MLKKREGRITMTRTSSLANQALRIAIVAAWIAAAMPARAAEWEPQPPMPDQFDWVQLKSGEWLKGEIKVMYEGSLEFESEELDTVNLDFGDIKQLRSARMS
jgi:hypothetical protein